MKESWVEISKKQIIFFYDLNTFWYEPLAEMELQLFLLS